MTVEDHDQEPQTIEELRARFEKLNERKTAARSELDKAEERLRLAKEAAVTTYGTADLKQLKEMLGTWQSENVEKRASYQRDLDSIEAELRRVKEQFGQNAT